MGEGVKSDAEDEEQNPRLLDVTRQQFDSNNVIGSQRSWLNVIGLTDGAGRERM